MIALTILAAAVAPSFDCLRARTLAERTICADAELAALDVEAARLYRLALARTPERAALVAEQRDFLNIRADCVPDRTDVPDCIRNAYLADIAALRARPALAGDAGGISSGPVLYHCDDGYPDAAVTFLALDPPQAYVGVVAVEEAQPLVADRAEPRVLVGRYDKGWIVDRKAGRLRINARICLPAR